MGNDLCCFLFGDLLWGFQGKVQWFIFMFKVDKLKEEICEYQKNEKPGQLSPEMNEEAAGCTGQVISVTNFWLPTLEISQNTDSFFLSLCKMCGRNQNMPHLYFHSGQVKLIFSILNLSASQKNAIAAQLKNTFKVKRKVSAVVGCCSSIGCTCTPAGSAVEDSALYRGWARWLA